MKQGGSKTGERARIQGMQPDGFTNGLLQVNKNPWVLMVHLDNWEWLCLFENRFVGQIGYPVIITGGAIKKRARDDSYFPILIEERVLEP